MLVLHAHWLPPRSPADRGGVLFWAESSAGEAPAWQRGRLAQHPRPRPHPFCAASQEVRRLLAQGGWQEAGKESQVVLRLPTTRSGPQPSPLLVHAWDLDEGEAGTPPYLAPWILSGILLPPLPALEALAHCPSWEQDEAGVGALHLAGDARYWHTAATLALEAASAHKLVPILVDPQAPGHAVQARWLPVLDSAADGPRLALLEQAMPPICRAEAVDTGPVTPRQLLSSFLNTTCDALARLSGAPAAPRIRAAKRDPLQRWLAALFGPDAAIQAASAPLQALLSSQRAWMRNLHAAGDRDFCIAFRLEAPSQQIEPVPAGKAPPAWRLHYLLQARDDPSLLVPAETVWQTGGSVLSELGHRFEQPQEKLLAGLGYAARLFPPIAASLKDKRPARLALETQQAYTFLRETAPLLEGSGFGLLAPPWWNQPGSRLGVRLRLKSKKQGADAISQSRLTLENLVSYQWELSLGDTALSEEEFRALAALKSPLVQIRGQWVQLDAGQIEAAIQFWQKQELRGDFGLLEAMQYTLGGQVAQGGLPLDEVIPEGWLAEWLERLKRNESLSQLEQPAGLQGVLRPYQRYGYSWLSFFRSFGLGACLADDMGLGKTIQTLALLLHEKETLGTLPAPTLLVCPTSVVTNWERETRRFAPGLTTLVHQGAGRMRGGELAQAVQQVDLVLTSYALVRQDAEALQSVNWLAVILDEAQNIKNPATRQTQAVRQIPADFRLALTGTPVENRLSELWSIMHFLNPGYLGSRQAFRSQYAIPVERYNDLEATRRLKQAVSPFILRRVKTDPSVIQDLPEKIETKVYCSLSEEQATLYQAVVQDVMQQVEESEGIQRRGLVLSMLMQLKQICNHPVQYLHQSSQEGRASLDDSLSGRSGKLERLAELMEEILAEGDRALIFTQFAEMGGLLAAGLPQITGAAVQFLHGGTPAKQRDQMVRRFQEDPHCPPVFILSLKAGGTGLNLTRANHVFHYDRWWNPAVEDQATDRAFRIGQQRNVQVHKFITTGTLEEMIDEMIESKKGLAQAVIGGGENWLTELSSAQLREMVTLRR